MFYLYPLELEEHHLFMVHYSHLNFLNHHSASWFALVIFKEFSLEFEERI